LRPPQIVVINITTVRQKVIRAEAKN
jgi:hypothetical protein